MAELIVRGERFPIPDRLTLGEIRDIERNADCSAGEIAEYLRRGDVRVLMEVVRVVMNRGRPTRVRGLELAALRPDDIEIEGA